MRSSFIITNQSDAKALEDLDKDNRLFKDNIPLLGWSFNFEEFDGVYITEHPLGHPPTYMDGKYFIMVGEIFNGDMSFCVSMYKEYGNDFINYLDGSFLFIIYDPSNQTIDFFTDPWATRQAHYTPGDFLYKFSTWPTETSKQLKWNSHYHFDIHNNEFKLIDGEIYKWDLRQYKDTLEDLTIAFDESVLKRYHENLVLTLGGADSSCIALSLADQKKSFNSVHLSVVQKEDENTLGAVIEYTKEYNNHFRFTELKEDNACNTEKAFYRQIHEVVPDFKFLWTGHGPDPIFENDGFGDEEFVMTNVDGQGDFKRGFELFPEDLSTIFPWTLFYGAKRFMNSTEVKALSQHVYWHAPYRDKKVAQEWLNTTHTLKNKKNKISNIFQEEYLGKRNIPMPTVKVGQVQQWKNWRSKKPKGEPRTQKRIHEQFL